MVFVVWFCVQGTAPARYSVPAPGVKLKLRLRDGTRDTCCPSTPHVLPWFLEVMGSNFLRRFQDCQFVGGRCELNRCLGKLRTNHRLKCRKKDKQIWIFSAVQDVSRCFFRAVHEHYGYEPHVLSSHSQWTMQPLPVLDLRVPNVVPGAVSIHGIEG